MKREYRHFLEDIIAAIDRIQEFLGDLTFEEFIHDDKTSSAVIRKLEIIGEAAKNIPSKVRDDLDLPWKEMIRMRDRISHAYFGVDLEIVWRVVKERIPDIKPLVVKMLKESNN